MLVLLLVSSLLPNIQSLKLEPVIQLHSDPVLPCIANITRQYFAETKNMVYLKSKSDDLLKFIHSLEKVSLIEKPFEDGMVNPILTYIIVVRNIHEFLQCMSDLASKSSWNPYAHFLVIIRILSSEELRRLFESLVDRRVYNVVVMNAISTELYTYNPFENFACGRYFKEVIYYGKCTDVTANIYPKKLTTGLKNCFFNVLVSHWPPYGVDPLREKYEAWDEVLSVGIEQYIFHMISEIEQFKYKIDIEPDSETFSTVSKNLTISGSMIRLARNEIDFMLGGFILIPSRARVFSYIYGHLDYIDEIRVMVKKAEHTPAWMDVYLEFSPLLWAIISFILMVYSALITILLKAKDKGHIVLVMFDYLLSHGSQLRSRYSVRWVLITWVVFANFVNSFYTTTLMSLTTRPSMTFQISDEETTIARGLEPCISFVMGKYLKAEENHGEIINDAAIGRPGCEKLVKSVRTVSKSDRLFTIVIYSIYYINRKQLCDEYGTSTVYSFRKPYSKIIYAMYYNKGFPLGERLHKLALRIREVGLSDKSIEDHYYALTLKYHFRQRGFVARFAIPWYLYGAGVLISTFTFAVEFASQYKRVTSVGPVLLYRTD